MPEQAPDQPANAEPGPATALRATVLPPHQRNEHVPPQSIPAGLEVTVPEPDLLIVRVHMTQLGMRKLPMRVFQSN